MKHRAKSAQYLLVVLFVAVVVALFTFEQTSHTQTKIDFNRDIRPILSDKCFACHGPDASAKKIKLRLDSEEAARSAIVPGQPDQSRLIKRITHKDEALRMPPADSGRTLSPREIELLTEWIRQGANWQSHWSFIPPTRPALPVVKNMAWPKNAIDYFVLARLEKEGLQPAPEADRATLLRRVSLDLTGLPPTLQELDNFLSDKSPNAYEKVVDRLLASPRYGERMAFKWLDAARYADTNGYQIDGERSMWRWRDWVIAAFNTNMPFDQFTIEQLGGDLLPNPRQDQIIATAFNRNHRTNAEDGIVPEEYAVEYVVDRVDTTSTVFLGLTMGCARCHNHKYDPHTQKEYYQLYAYFNSIPEDGRASNYGNSAPWISAPTEAQQRAHAKLENDLRAAEAQLAQFIRTNAVAQKRWEQTLSAQKPLQWFPTNDLLFHYALDADTQPFISETMTKVRMDAPDQEIVEKKDAKTLDIGFKSGAPKFVVAPTGQGVAFDGNILFDAGKIADFNFRDRLKDYKDQFTLTAWFYPESDQSGAIVTHMSDASGEKDNNLPKGRGYGLFVANGKVHFNLVGVWADDSFRVETAEPIALKQWHQVIATFDATEPYEKVQIFLNGQKQKLKINNPRLFRSFGDANANLRIGAGGGPEFRFKGMIDEVRVYKSLPTANDIAILSCAETLQTIAATPIKQRSAAQQHKLTEAWLESANEAQSWLKQIRDLTQRRTLLEAEFPTLMVMQEMPQPRPTYLLRRGAYDLPTEKVGRAIPASLHTTSSAGTPTNRLELARWLVSPANPLTARVTVNRFWQQFFGTGLVKTAEDFGSQGELPSHPELLDWLAVAFREGMMNSERGTMNERQKENSGLHRSSLRVHGWDTKALLKTIVMSATYRQSSAIPRSSLGVPRSEVDPDNRLLARGPRYRLSAEMIRDQALLASGLLVEKLGGPSVKPYQPEGLWKDMTFSNMTNYGQAKDEGLWRRSLYTYWKRTILNPNMQVFDATAREACTVRDVRTNTPLQALNLMNDVTYVEAARLLAERSILAKTTPEDRLVMAFRTVTSRPPDQQERQVLLENLQAQLTFFHANLTEAAKLLNIGEKRNDPKLNPAEVAAYATTMSLILNLDEAITKQ